MGIVYIATSLVVLIGIFVALKKTSQDYTIKKITKEIETQDIQDRKAALGLTLRLRKGDKLKFYHSDIKFHHGSKDNYIYITEVTPEEITYETDFFPPQPPIKCSRKKFAERHYRAIGEFFRTQYWR